MCGRFSIHLADLSEIGGALGVTRSGIEVWEPRFNVAPTQHAPVVRARDERRVDLLRWGLVPHWAKDVSIGARMINARIETVADKPAFRDAFAKRRCIVPATGYFEWKREAGSSQPMWIHPEGAPMLWLAGLWSCWGTPEDRLETFTILTREAIGELASIHDRMPVALSADMAGQWLTGPADPDLLHAVSNASARAASLLAEPVSRRVNDVRNDDGACIARWEGPSARQLSLF